MRTLRRCSALTLAALFACAEQHEEPEMEPQPPQAGDVSRSDDGAQVAGDRPAAAPEPSPTEDEPHTDPQATTPPVWTPVLDSFPGRLTGKPDICARQIFDSLAPPAHVQLEQLCTYRVVPWPKITPKFLRVTVDGVDRRLGQAADGWMVAQDAQGVTLLGAACETARAGAMIEFTAECMTLDVK